MYFEGFILLIIIINTLILALDWYQMPSNLIGYFDDLNYFFTAIFTIEAGLKIIAEGKYYFRQGWNIFDFIIVVVSYVAIIIA